MTMATRLKHQLSPLITARSRGRKLIKCPINFVGTHILIVYAKQSPDESRFFQKLRYSVDIDPRKLFFTNYIKLHIDYASVVSDKCSDIIRNILNSLYRGAVKLIFPGTTVFNKGLLIYRVLNNEAPEYT